MKPRPEDALGNGEEIDVPKAKTDGYYVQFPEEPLQAAIDAHDNEPFGSIEECMEFVADSEDVGRTFNVVDIDGKVHMTGIVTHDSVEEIKVDSLRR
jgi:hypothetical protein